MRLCKAAAAALLVPLLLTSGCFEPFEPIALSLEFEASYSKNEDGSCEVTYTTRANGIGTGQWERVVIRKRATVLAEYIGPRTAEFWGQPTISAGETLTGLPVAVGATPDIAIEVGVRMGGPERTIDLVPNCAEAR